MVMVMSKFANKPPPPSVPTHILDTTMTCSSGSKDVSICNSKLLVVMNVLITYIKPPKN